MSPRFPNLDDRRFQDIVDEAKRLIPQYCPEWTNLEPSDPGMTLVELFAWMTDMLVYRLNQVPEVFYLRMLDLLGVQPFPPQAARADVTFWLAGDVVDDVTIPCGTEVSTQGGQPVVFATTQELSVRQPQLIAAVTGGANERLTDVWERLSNGQPVPLAEREPVADDGLHLGFAGSLAHTALMLDVRAAIDGIGADPKDPPLVWEVWAGEWWAPARVYSDTTGGLQRDGSVVVLVSDAHAPLTLAGRRAHWLRARFTKPGEDQHPYAARPTIQSLRATAVGGTVSAEHAQTMDAEVLGISDGGPDQRFATSVAPVLARRAGETVRTESDQVTTEWEEVASFEVSGPSDAHYMWDGASGEIRFGPTIRYPDGEIRRHGAVPPDGAEVSVSTYRTGGGAIGNVGANTLVVLRSTLPGVVSVSNLTPAFGGLDGETVENLLRRGPMALRTGQQVVTGEDYERLALELEPSIARVRCLPPVESGGPIRLLVVPYPWTPLTGRNDLDAFALSGEQVARLRSALDDRRVLGSTVEIGTPFYTGVSVAALVAALPGRPAAVVRDRATDAINAFLDPINGGPDGRGWPFDDDLRVHTLFRVLEGVEGVDRVEEVLLFDYDLRSGQRLGTGRDVIRLSSDALFLSACPQVVVR